MLLIMQEKIVWVLDEAEIVWRILHLQLMINWQQIWNYLIVCELPGLKVPREEA